MHPDLTPTLKFEITEAQIDAYQRDGYVVLRKVFDQAWVDYMRTAIDRAKENPGPLFEVYTREGEPGHAWADHQVWERLDEFRVFMFDSPAPAVAARLARSTILNVLYDHLLVKEPGTELRTPWHQDLPYWPFSGEKIITLWTPFDSVPKHNGLEVVGGTHHGTMYNPFNFQSKEQFTGTDYTPMPDIQSERDKYNIIGYDMEQGDCLVFHARAIHAAHGNSGPHQRRALITHWAGDDVRYKKPVGELALNATDPGLEDGELIDGCDLYPRVWPRDLSSD